MTTIGASVDRSDVYKVIDGERDYQDSMWNADTTASKGLHTPGEFLLMMEHYIAEARRAYCSAGEPQATTKMLDRMRCVTGLGIACFEQNGVPARGEAQSVTVAYNKLVEHLKSAPTEAPYNVLAEACVRLPDDRMLSTPPLIRPEDQT
jgi:hypothetical protein